MDKAVSVAVLKKSRMFATPALFGLGMSVSFAAHAQQDSASPGAAAADTAPASRPADASAAPPTVNECVAIHREAQSLRKQYRLVESRSLLGDCSNAACPAPVKRDCLRWADEIAVQLPSVVFRLDSADASATSEIKVFVDGDLISPTLPSRAIDVNPGSHHFRFVMEGKPPLEKNVVLTEGEKYRAIAIKFDSEAAPGQPNAASDKATPTQPAASAATKPSPQLTRPVPVASYVFAGVGAAAAINFAIWGALSKSLLNELERECAPTCEQSYVDRVHTRALIADVSLGVSVVSLATASVFYFLRPTVEMPAEVNVGILPHGGFIGTIGIKEF